MFRTLALAFLVLAAAMPAAAQRQSLGVFGLWGAFQGDGRCWAVAEPQGARQSAEARPFVAIGHWPARGISGQVHVRLSREKRPASAVLLRIDGQSFQLQGAGRDAWAAGPEADREIRAAMRTGMDMVVETRSATGVLVRDRYRLRGAASAIDAAAIACARRR